MVRKIVSINEERCNGCGACANACHEGAIAMIDGKAKLIKDDYCDGLGDCLPACPMDAITIIEREAAAYDEAAVKERMSKRQNRLRQWPVQIKLLPITAPYYENADLLIAADCSAYAYADFHREFVQNRIVMVGCPKLDAVDYAQKLEAIIRANNIRSITVVRMEVPCCGGLSHAAVEALRNSGKMIPWQVITITCDGKIQTD